MTPSLQTGEPSEATIAAPSLDDGGLVVVVEIPPVPLPTTSDVPASTKTTTRRSSRSKGAKNNRRKSLVQLERTITDRTRHLLESLHSSQEPLTWGIRDALSPSSSSSRRSSKSKKGAANDGVKELGHDDVEVGKLVGKGGFSHVYELKAIHRSSFLNSIEGDDDSIHSHHSSSSSAGEVVAKNFVVKLLNATIRQGDRDRYRTAAADLAFEAKLLSSISHPNIVRLRGVTRGCQISALYAGGKQRRQREGDDANSADFEQRGYFIVLDKLECTLEERIEEWRVEKRSLEKQESLFVRRFRRSSSLEMQKSLKKESLRRRFRRSCSLEMPGRSSSDDEQDEQGQVVKPPSPAPPARLRRRSSLMMLRRSSSMPEPDNNTNKTPDVSGEDKQLAIKKSPSPTRGHNRRSSFMMLRRLSSFSVAEPSAELKTCDARREDDQQLAIKPPPPLARLKRQSSFDVMALRRWRWRSSSSVSNNSDDAAEVQLDRPSPRHCCAPGTKSTMMTSDASSSAIIAPGDHRKQAPKREFLRRRLDVARQIARAMLYMHSKRILYRDLKPGNVGFDSATGDVKIFDFGLARFLPKKKGDDDGDNEDERRLTAMAGTPRYMAPEVAKCKRYGPPADVYSFGLVLWEILSLKRPFDGITRVQMQVKVVYGSTRPKVDRVKWPKSVCDLMERCWAADPRERPQFGRILDVLDRELDAF